MNVRILTDFEEQIESLYSIPRANQFSNLAVSLTRFEVAFFTSPEGVILIAGAVRHRLD